VGTIGKTIEGSDIREQGARKRIKKHTWRTQRGFDPNRFGHRSLIRNKLVCKDIKEGGDAAREPGRVAAVSTEAEAETAAILEKRES